MDNKAQVIAVIFLMVLIFYLMSVLSSLLVPLAFALLAAVTFQPLIYFLKRKKTPVWLILPLVSIISLALLFGIFNIILETSSSIAEQQAFLLQRLEIKLNDILFWTNSLTNMDLNAKSFFAELKNNIGAGWMTQTAGGVAQGIGVFSSSFTMFALYYVFLLAGMTNYRSYLIYVGGENYQPLLITYEKIQSSVNRYMIIKTLISLITAIFVTVICYIFGLKFPLFWGFIAFLLNFIPSIGSILATIFPTLMAIIQFDSLETIVLVVALLGSVQMLMGNVIEPKVMGTSLRLNTLTVLFGLVFWGYLWGVSGMILAVPLLVIIKLIFEQFPSFSIISRIMGYPDKEEVENIKRMEKVREKEDSENNEKGEKNAT